MKHKLEFFARNNVKLAIENDKELNNFINQKETKKALRNANFILKMISVLGAEKKQLIMAKVKEGLKENFSDKFNDEQLEELIALIQKKDRRFEENLQKLLDKAQK